MWLVISKSWLCHGRVMQLEIAMIIVNNKCTLYYILSTLDYYHPQFIPYQIDEAQNEVAASQLLFFILPQRFLIQSSFSLELKDKYFLGLSRFMGNHLHNRMISMVLQPQNCLSISRFLEMLCTKYISSFPHSNFIMQTKLKF